MNNKYFTEYECKKCGYAGEECETHIFYGEEDEVIDSTYSCPRCGEYEEIYKKRY